MGNGFSINSEEFLGFKGVHEECKEFSWSIKGVI